MIKNSEKCPSCRTSWANHEVLKKDGTVYMPPCRGAEGCPAKYDPNVGRVEIPNTCAHCAKKYTWSTASSLWGHLESPMPLACGSCDQTSYMWLTNGFITTRGKTMEESLAEQRVAVEKKISAAMVRGREAHRQVEESLRNEGPEHTCRVCKEPWTTHAPWSPGIQGMEDPRRYEIPETPCPARYGISQTGTAWVTVPHRCPHCENSRTVVAKPFAQALRLSMRECPECSRTYRMHNFQAMKEEEYAQKVRPDQRVEAPLARRHGRHAQEDGGGKHHAGGTGQEAPGHDGGGVAAPARGSRQDAARHGGQDRQRTWVESRTEGRVARPKMVAVPEVRAGIYLARETLISLRLQDHSLAVSREQVHLQFVVQEAVNSQDVMDRAPVIERVVGFLARLDVSKLSKDDAKLVEYALKKLMRAMYTPGNRD